MEEQLSGPSGVGAGAHVLDGVAQLGMRVVLLPAVATGPTPVGQLDYPEEPRHLREPGHGWSSQVEQKVLKLRVGTRSEGGGDAQWVHLGFRSPSALCRSD